MPRCVRESESAKCVPGALHQHPWREAVLRKWVAGSLGGISQFVLCHPLDTIKARLQYLPPSEATIANAMRGVGIGGLYRGASLPLLSSGFTFGWFFMANEAARCAIVEPLLGWTTTSHPILVPAACGILSAPPVSLVVAPVEVWKVRRQLRLPTRVTSPTGVVDTRLRLSYAYRGGGVIFAQRLVGLPMYFAVYGGVRDLMHATQFEGLRLGPTIQWAVSVILGGACSGLSYWALAYPLDTIKCQVIATGKSASSVVHTIISRRSSVASLYRGFSVCALRTVIATPTTWLAVEFSDTYFASQ